jgi:uncharacterized protein YegL
MNAMRPPFNAYRGGDAHLFVSYSRRDATLVYPELERLHRLGYRIWYDEGISPGSEWTEAIAQAIMRSTFFLVFVSPRAMASKHVRNEINFALSRGKPLLAVHLEGTELPLGIELQIGTGQAILKHSLDEERYHRSLEQGLPEVLRAVAAAAPPVEPSYGYWRRLPIFLLLDCSASTAGEPIQAMRQGIRALINDMRGDPLALEQAFVSVIRFGASAKQLMPLTDLLSFEEPDLKPDPPQPDGDTTALGQALRCLLNCIDSEVVPSSARRKGDYKPLIFLMLEGNPTDSWAWAADELKARKPGNIIACAAGPGVDHAVLRRITDVVVDLNTIQPEQLRAFFKWVSVSVKAGSVKVE